jgi:hypothetical protein
MVSKMVLLSPLERKKQVYVQIRQNRVEDVESSGGDHRHDPGFARGLVAEETGDGTLDQNGNNRHIWYREVKVQHSIQEPNCNSSEKIEEQRISQADPPTAPAYCFENANFDRQVEQRNHQQPSVNQPQGLTPIITTAKINQSDRR